MLCEGTWATSDTGSISGLLPIGIERGIYNDLGVTALDRSGYHESNLIPSDEILIQCKDAWGSLGIVSANYVVGNWSSLEMVPVVKPPFSVCSPWGIFQQ